MMPTITDESSNSTQTKVYAVDVRFTEQMLYVVLNDGREIGLPFYKLHWLSWLAQATPEQRLKWHIEPRGYAVYWEELDDGLEVAHILSLQVVG